MDMEIDGITGHYCIVRSSASGVWAGKVERVTDAGATCTVRLSAGRRIWSWSGAGSCSGLAAHGPSEGKIAPPIDGVILGVCEILRASEAAAAKIQEFAEWRP